MNTEIFFSNFDLLAEAPNGVQKLRELIFKLALAGKLVCQDAEEETRYAKRVWIATSF